MSWKGQDRIADAIAIWVDLCQKKPRVIILLSVLLTALSAGFLAENTKINTDNENMLSAELTFRKNAIAVDREFPDLDGNMVIVLEARNRDMVDDALFDIVSRLRNEPDTFLSVSAPATDPFLLRHGLLYLDLEELDDLSARLISAQPFLGTLWQSPNLAGLIELLELIKDGGDEAADGYDAVAVVLDRMSEVVEQSNAGTTVPLEWTGLLTGEKASEPGIPRRLIVVKPALNYDSLQPADVAKTRVEEIAAELGYKSPDYVVRFTGSAALEDDELSSVQEGMGLAGLVSLTLVTIVLVAGLRSAGMVLSLFVTLVFGLIWTAALAIATIGSFNLISVAFAVLFVGLSVDFGIHFSLRCKEYAARGLEWGDAIVDGARSVGPSLALCAVTTSVAFFSFLPTSYSGLAELGLISGMGMFIAFIANVTLLPALIKVMARKSSISTAAKSGLNLEERIAKSSRLIIVIAVLGVIASMLPAQSVRFDFDPMNLRDADAPSMRTLADITEQGLITPYSAEILVSDQDQSRGMADRLMMLPSVAGVRNVLSLVPDDQDDKLEIIDDLALVVGPSFFSPQGNVSLGDVESADLLGKVQSALSALGNVPELAQSTQRLGTAFSEAPASQVGQLNVVLFAGLPGRLRTLAESLSPSFIEVENLPPNLVAPFVSAAGIHRIVVEPNIDTRDPGELRKFVQDVHSVAPEATGSPFIIVGAGDAVLTAFLEALVIAVTVIALIVWFVLRRIRDVIMIFVPVSVAALWTVGLSSLLNLPFNFANVIVLPLLFGLSVDFGIHLVLRFRETELISSAMATTTPRAILLSAMTTLCSFGSIMLSAHPGTASMGALLTISILVSLMALLLLLPALLSVWSKG